MTFYELKLWFCDLWTTDETTARNTQNRLIKNQLAPEFIVHHYTSVNSIKKALAKCNLQKEGDI